MKDWRCGRCKSTLLYQEADGIECVSCGEYTSFKRPCSECLPVVVYHELGNCPQTVEWFPGAGRLGRPPTVRLLPGGGWSGKFDRCKRCGTDTVHHHAKGMCRPCYYASRDRGRKATA